MPLLRQEEISPKQGDTAHCRVERERIVRNLHHDAQTARSL